MERENQREEAERLLKESTERLQAMKDDLEAFKVSLELTGIDLAGAEDAVERGDSEASASEFKYAVESMASSVRDVLELASSFTTPKTEATLRSMLDKVNNMRIVAWRWVQRLKAERETNREAMGNPACPAMIVEGITDMASPEAIEFCLNKCKYQTACDPDPKQQYIPVAP